MSSPLTRADLSAEARDTPRAGNIYADAAYACVAPALVASTHRDLVRSQAVDAARLGNVYGEQASAGVLTVRGGYVDRATVRAEARSASRAPVL